MNAAEIMKTTVRIAATPAEVFPYFIDPSLIVMWIGTWADLNPQPGGIFALDIHGTPARGTYITVEPPTRAIFTWGIPGNETLPPGSSTVEIVLTPDGNETIVELTHRDLPLDERSPHKSGWTTCLESLRQAASRHNTNTHPRPTRNRNTPPCQNPSRQQSNTYYEH